MKFLVLILLCSSTVTLHAQNDTIYEDLSYALKHPESIVHLDLTYQDVKPRKLRQLSKLEHLETLNLEGLLLKRFPKSITECKQLRIIDLDINDIEHLPKEIGQLKQLEELTLNYNHLQSLPDELFTLPKLKVLDVASKEKTPFLSEKVVELKQLEWLSCNTDSAHFQKVILPLQHLKKLEVFSSEMITPCILLEFPQLVEFRMTINNMGEYKPFDCSLTELEHLKRFYLYTRDCCWPYVMVTQEEYQEIRALFPKECSVSGIINEQEYQEIKSDIELR